MSTGIGGLELRITHRNPIVRKLFAVFGGILVSLSILVGFGSLASTILHRPVLLEAERSNSMFPLLQRGDLTLIWPVINSKDIHKGDIIMYRTSTGTYSSLGWIVHRVVGGNAETGFITRGDANSYTDQSIGGAPPVKPEWVVNTVPIILGQPIVIPKLGSLALWGQNHQQQLAAIVLSLIVIGLWMGFLKKNRRSQGRVIKPDLRRALLTLGLGLAVTVALSIMTMNNVVRFKSDYNVSGTQALASTNGLGTLELGKVVSKDLGSQLAQKTAIPLVRVALTTDPDMYFDQNLALLLPGQSSPDLKLTIEPQHTGMHHAFLTIGYFPPFLPPSWIYPLVRVNLFLAIFMVAVVPAIPFFLAPFIIRRQRRQVANALKRAIRRLKVL